MPVDRFSHLGLCVADLERSLRFYRDVLGFRERARLDVAGEPASRLLDLADVALHALYLERDGLRLELLHFASPGHAELVAPRPMNGLGLTHLSLRVSDVDALLPQVEAAGGRVLASSRIDAGPVVALFVLDPDGTRLELVQAPGDPEKLPGE
jgi:catechol 2,3-dioxygenase-like lactoylglutathione lyase family enzyme